MKSTAPRTSIGLSNNLQIFTSLNLFVFQTAGLSSKSYLLASFISIPFIRLFSTVISILSPSFSLLYRNNIGKSAFEINVQFECLRNLQVKVEIYR